MLALAAAGPTAAISRAQDAWFRIRTPHFAILSRGDEYRARAWAFELEQFTQAMSVGFPWMRDPLPPVTVVIFRYDRDFQPFKPLDRGRPAAVAGLFARTPYADVIGLDGEATGIDVHRTILHEAVHWFFSSRARPLPIWAEEGIAELYSTLRMEDSTHAVIGDPIPEHVALLRRGIALPLPQVFDATRATLHYNETNRTGYFYAESWLMAHYALFSDNFERGGGLDLYLHLLNEGRDSNDAFQRSFGADYAEIQRRLQVYVINGRYHTGLIAIPNTIRPAEFVMDRPNPAELELALGGLLTVTRTPAEASVHLLAAAREAPEDPRPWEQLGSFALGDRDLALAADRFRRAVAAGSYNYLAYFHLAALEQYGAARDPTGSAAAVSALLRRAIELRPDFVPAYQNLAGLIYAENPGDPRDAGLMAAGLKLDPADPMLVLGAAAAAITGGDRAQGLQALSDLLAHLPPASSPRVAALARLILKREALRDLNRRIGELAANHQYAAVVAAIDAARASGLDFDASEQGQLASARQRALDLQRAESP